MEIIINGKGCSIHKNEIAYYVIYSEESAAVKAANVRVLLDGAAEKAKVRPLSAGIAPQISGAEISFTAKIPQKLSLEFPDSERLPIFLFLYEQEKPIEITDKVRRFSAGEYHIDELELKSGDTLYLEEGAVLHAHLWAKEAENITVCGRGIVDLEGYSRKGRRMVRFNSCKNILFKDVTFTGSYGWCCAFFGCENITLDSVNIMTWLVTGDGVDIVGSHNAEIKNSFIRTNDDCISLKATAYCGDDGLANVYNVKAHNCVLWNSIYGNGIEIGFETRCDEIYDVEFYDIDIIHVEDPGWQGSGTLTIHNGDRARVHDIVYRDIRIEDSKTRIFDFKVIESEYSKDAERGAIEDILVENVSVVDGPFPPSILNGYEPEKHPVRRIKFVNFSAHGQRIDNYLDARMICEKIRSINFEVN